MSLFRPSVLAVAVGSLLTSGYTLAQSAPSEIQEIQVTGQLSRYSALKSDTPIMETARSVSIEGLQDIIDKGAITLDDVFTYSSGVYGKTYGFATRGDWVKVRGLDVPQYQDSLQSLFGNYNNTRPDVYTLEQVEVLKGPASVLYGQGSPGGIVNVVSKLPKAESAHELLAELGSFDRQQLAFDSTGALDSDEQWLYRAVGVYRDTDTQVDQVNENTRVFAPSITWQPNQQTRVTALLNRTETDSDVGAQFLPVYGTLLPAPNGQFIDNSTYTGDPDFNYYDTETTSLTLLAEHQFNSVWSLELTSRYTDAKADYQQAWTAFIGGDRYVRNADGSLYGDGLVPRSFYGSKSTSEQAALDARLRANFQTGALFHEVLIGTQYQDVTLGESGFYDYARGYDVATGTVLDDSTWINVFDPQYGNIPAASEFTYAVSPDSTTEDLGLYINDQISVGNWRITAGVRFDDTETRTGTSSQSDDAVSTSVGALYQFDNGLSPYVSFAESFDPVIGDNGNGEPLDPQEGEQWEAGFKYQPSTFPAMFTLAYFDITQTNLNDPSALVGEYQQQRGEASITGVELEGIVFMGDLSLELNASQLDTESAEGYRLASVPERQASTWLTWRPGDFEGFKAGAGLRYVGESWDGTDQLRTPSYTLGDLMVGYQTGPWDLTLNARNVADKEFQATCLSRGDCFPGEARSVVGRVRYQF
ncbi:iron complex outermembrane receptor protein [Marinimicrobium koreense]|uniref:Iron complex outermembrane receptor protein n=1 Tax=Marinimicrobium koreense TaxID=306545 RepID=A0A3N1NWG5_9GAMM|nr:TonB-dependent siderophore receptor [Marinimicrobium koreense]ROQ20535.1 iron complex outermembrane receptor protein [Marinimicrobium koreense]